MLLVTFLGWLNDLLERRIVTFYGLGDEGWSRIESPGIDLFP